MLAIIGGTGLTQLANLEITHRQVARTPYGEPSGALTFGNINGHEVIFLARHGYGHTIPPHEVNYRANLWALQEQKVSHIVSVASVGGIHPDLTPGALVVPDQIIDYTYGRKHSFYNGGDKSVTHIDFTEPYSPCMRAKIMAAIAAAGERAIDSGVYAAVQGPRLESAAEINRLERDGATMVGMTGMPEAALARELGLNYAAIGVVANHAAGRGNSKIAISGAEVQTTLAQAMERVRTVLAHLVALHNEG
ncbi:putative S-methyl-5'-thioinosine phosphorylase [Sulfuriferula plumbiphila]|uniref:Probable 6-oxopurine nucleoside phosphorylase n=1 Tax=Sulfuriferula plumbiphila TaxID=171865 RepID=A0A512L5L8_9PROT|nr:S-methyl-5'-thioinosine phosphorylase [Sulfuriferula plumbiphila]BBP03452.1 putative S-methyl-5'-thioinosine phosphorylase [Sulfuriferula plumbiphila]GEP29777.1 putative S-methyl-5'-thioinosine phosphorylase [Sulfuriferula plumbiphila]